MNRFLKVLLVSAAALALLVGLVALKVHHDRTRVRVERLTISSDKLPVGRPLRIMQIADFHNGVGASAESVLAKMRAEQPQFVLITGDVVNTHDDDLEPLRELLTGLRAHGRPVFAVWGNHDHWSGRLPELRRLYAENGVTVLDHGRVLLEHRGMRFTLVGTDDPSIGRDDLDRAMRGVDPNTFTLLMTHSPEIRRDLVGRGIDLAVVGHTHGGQVRLPFKGCVVAPNQGWWPTYCRGLFDIDGTQLYVDSGLGSASPKVRFNVQAQVTMITVRSGQVTTQR